MAIIAWSAPSSAHSSIAVTSSGMSAATPSIEKRFEPI